MKKIFLIVELTDEKENHVYSILYTGVMTRRNIYAKLTQNTGCTEPEYIKVSKWFTKDITESVDTVFAERMFRSISVPYDVGMNDSLIQQGTKSFPDGILEAVNAHVEENEQFFATI